MAKNTAKLAMSDDSTKQLNLFTQPIEIIVEESCTVERAAELTKRSISSIYSKIRQNKTYKREVDTGEWRVYRQGKTAHNIKVKVAFVYSPQETYWQVA
jgi:hypothetical protein